MRAGQHTDGDNPRNGEALHATCLVDGLAVFFTTRSTERSDVTGLLRLAVPRLGSVDRAAFGFSPRQDEAHLDDDLARTWRATGMHCRLEARTVRSSPL